MATIDRRALLVFACVISHIQTTPVHLPKDKKMHGRRERRRRIKYASRSMKIDAALPPISSRTQRKRCQRCPFTPPIRIGGVRLNYIQRNSSVDLKVNWPTDQNSTTTDGTYSNVVAGPKRMAADPISSIQTAAVSLLCLDISQRCA